MPDGTPRQGNPVHRTSRLFVALVPPAVVVAPLAAAVAPLRAAHPALAWVASERWHLTLAFLRNVPDEVRPALWERAHGGLRPLATAVGRAAGRAGIQVEDRPFRAHVTLARARPGRPVDLRPLADALAQVRCPPWTADRLVLVRSRLGPDPRYEEEAGWPLSGRPGSPP